MVRAKAQITAVTLTTIQMVIAVMVMAIVFIYRTLAVAQILRVGMVEAVTQTVTPQVTLRANKVAEVST